MKQLILFEIPTTPTTVIEPVLSKDLRCRKCNFIYNHQYGKMKYCEKQKDTRTAYGNKKIKANDPACSLFESKSLIVYLSRT